jgi:hypothetical protein
LAAVVIAGVLWWLLAGSGSGAPLAEKHTIEGSITLVDLDGYGDDFAGGCEGTGGYSDISAGAAVTVRDGEGSMLATSDLDSGEDDGFGCTFPFTVQDVPNAHFYEIEVSHRGSLSYSKDEMQANRWTVDFSLGD